MCVRGVGELVLLADLVIVRVVLVLYTCRMQDFQGCGGSIQGWKSRKTGSMQQPVWIACRGPLRGCSTKSWVWNQRIGEDPGRETFQEHGYLLREISGFQREPWRELSGDTGNEVFAQGYPNLLEIHIPPLCAWEGHWTSDS